MNKVLIPAKIRLVDPTPNHKQKAQAALLETLQLKNLDIQPDLLYLEAVLVTEGFNDNDDVFLHEELKAALNTPLLKPINWQHNEKDIMGVLYSVEARDLNGNVLTEVGDGPFEVVVQGALWHLLPHLQEKAQKVKARIEKNNLFVSMECWFDSYDYAFQTGSELPEVISKDKNDYVEGLLKVNGGAGKLDKYRVGRALRNIVFGGMGLVDKPANKRSDILNVLDGYKQQNSFAKDDSNTKEDLPMTNQLASASNAGDNTEVVVKRILEEAKREDELVLARERVKQLELELKSANDSAAALRQSMAEMVKGLDPVVTASMATPEEIALIDQATDKYAAKIAFIQKSRQKASASNHEDEVKTLREENIKLRASFREAEVTNLFKDLDIFTAEELAQSLASAKSLDEKSYAVWLDDKKLLAKKIRELREKAKLVPKDGAEKLGGDGSELKRMGKGPSDVPLKTLATEGLEELFTEVKEPNPGDADNTFAGDENPMQAVVASLFAPVDRKSNKKN